MPDTDLRDRVAVITGASSGIGAAIARSFAGSGIKTVLAARSAEKLDRVAGEIKAMGASTRTGRSALSRPSAASPPGSTSTAMILVPDA